MHVDALRCSECGETYTSSDPRYRCGCGGPLEVVYDYGEIRGAISWGLFESRDFAHFRYRELLPVAEAGNMVGMGCGGTPLVASRTLGDDLGLPGVHFKVESTNPTASFKDRGTSVEIGRALDHGAGRVVAASTGNMGASIAAYAARAGVGARVYVPRGLRGPKRRQMEAYGAQVVEVDGGYEEAEGEARRLWEEEGVYLMGDYPYRGEGQKTVGFELADQGPPDVVVLPVGNGTLLRYTWKAFSELSMLGLLESPPHLVAVQAEGCSTVVRALDEGLDEVEPVEEPETVASAIEVGNPVDGQGALEAVRDSGGFGVEVSDDRILGARDLLAEREGLYAEEAGAVAFGGVMEARKEFDGDEEVVSVVTGHGLKT